MAITYGDPNIRRKLDAFKLVDSLAINPLLEAITCAQDLRNLRKEIADDRKSLDDPEQRQIATQTLLKATVDEFYAWKMVAEFIYAKPKHVELSGQVTLEQVLDASLGLLPPANS